MVRRMLGIGLVLGLVLVPVVSCSSSGKGKGAPGEKALAEGSFGTMAPVCGRARSKNKAGDTVGVTDSSITITTISDAGSSIQPGLNQEFWDVATVFSKWCNSLGGIHGRKIIVNQGDAQITEYPKAIAAACQSSFALVGGGGAFDDIGQQARIDCNLPAFPAFQASSVMRDSDLTFPPAPTPVDQRTVGLLKLLAREFPGSTARPGVVYGNFGTVKMIKAQLERALAKTGLWTIPDGGSSVFVYQGTYNVLGDNNWNAIAKDIAQNQVTSLLVAGQPKDFASLVNAIDATGYKSLKWVFSEPNGYDQVFIQAAEQALADVPVYVPLYVAPFEVAGQANDAGKAVQQYLDLFEEFLPNGKSRAMLGLNAFAAWLLFAQAADGCGADLSRDCIVAQVGKITKFDAGGLMGTRNPSEPGQASQCFTAMHAVPTNKAPSGFEVWDKVKVTSNVFNCSPDNVVDLDLDPGFWKKYGHGPKRADPSASLDG